MNARRHIASLVVFASFTVCSCSSGGPGSGTGNDSAPRGTGHTPTFTYDQTAGGCGDVFLYKGTTNKLEVLWVSADKKKLPLPDNGSKTFDLAAAPDGLQVVVDLWEAAPRFSAYCNDISPDTRREAIWKAVQGKITLTVHGPPGGPGPGERYKVSARLEGVVFDDGAGHRATLKEETFTDVEVGWYAG